MNNRLILSSNSPRRKQLLQELGFSFEVKTVDFDEDFPNEMPASEVARYLAIGKNNAHREVLDNELILTADTVVVFQNRVLGKPTSISEAMQVLKELSDNVHDVYSGVCISSLEKTISFQSKTEVKFHPLGSKEISYYAEKFRPLDKAGSYGIQEWIGSVGVAWMKGSYYNVMGLPTDLVYQSLTQDFKVQIEDLA